MTYDHLAFTLKFPGPGRAAVIGVPPGFPLLHWPDGSMCELAFCLFDWLFDVRGLNVGTLRRLAFDLREWLAFCAWRGWDAEEPNDARLGAWRAYLVDPSGGGIDAGLAENKVARIFAMYVNMHRAMPIGRNGARVSVIHVLDRKRPARDLVEVLCDDGLHEPAGDITDASDGSSADRLTARRIGKRRKLRWALAGKRKARGLPRPIPTERQARDVLARLRSGVAGEGAGGYPSHLSERDWLIGRAQQGAGCRAVECSRLNIDAIRAMLVENGVPAGIAAPMGEHPLDALAADPAGWRAMMDGLERLEASGRTTMSLRLEGKNAKERLAPIGFDLVRDLLDVGVASARRAQLAAWRGAGWLGASPSGLFLSDKTKAPLREGSISDLMSKAFSAAPAIPGSGHRMRALYAVTTAIRIFGDCLARFGGQVSPAMVEAAHAEIAAALGHASISTTVTWYLDLARVYHLHGLKHRDGVLAIIHSEVADVPDRLTEAKLLVLRKTVRALLKAELGSEYIELLDLLPDEADLRRPVPLAA